MLVLTRRRGEKVVIKIGEQRCLLTLVSVDRGQVRLGFTAPQGVTILREEVERAIDKAVDAAGQQEMLGP